MTPEQREAHRQKNIAWRAANPDYFKNRTANLPPEKREELKKRAADRQRKSPKRKGQWEKFNAKNGDYRRAYYLKNAEKIKAYQKAHRQKPGVREKQNARILNRKRTDPEFALLKRLRSRLCRAVTLAGTKKHEKTIELTGCDILFLKGWLESKFKQGMTWRNYGRKGWHIDHILPCSSFDLSQESERRKCFHYSNLQPLWALENWSKSNKVSNLLSVIDLTPARFQVAA